MNMNLPSNMPPAAQQKAQEGLKNAKEAFKAFENKQQADFKALPIQQQTFVEYLSLVGDKATVAGFKSYAEQKGVTGVFNMTPELDAKLGSDKGAFGTGMTTTLNKQTGEVSLTYVAPKGFMGLEKETDAFAQAVEQDTKASPLQDKRPTSINRNTASEAALKIPGNDDTAQALGRALIKTFEEGKSFSEVLKMADAELGSKETYFRTKMSPEGMASLKTIAAEQAKLLNKPELAEQFNTQLDALQNTLPEKSPQQQQYEADLKKQGLITKWQPMVQITSEGRGQLDVQSPEVRLGKNGKWVGSAVITVGNNGGIEGEGLQIFGSLTARTVDPIKTPIGKAQARITVSAGYGEDGIEYSGERRDYETNGTATTPITKTTTNPGGFSGTSSTQNYIGNINPETGLPVSLAVGTPTVTKNQADEQINIARGNAILNWGPRRLVNIAKANGLSDSAFAQIKGEISSVPKDADKTHGYWNVQAGAIARKAMGSGYDKFIADAKAAGIDTEDAHKIVFNAFVGVEAGIRFPLGNSAVAELYAKAVANSNGPEQVEGGARVKWAPGFLK